MIAVILQKTQQMKKTTKTTKTEFCAQSLSAKLKKKILQNNTWLFCTKTKMVRNSVLQLDKSKRSTKLLALLI